MRCDYARYKRGGVDAVSGSTRGMQMTDNLDKLIEEASKDQKKKAAIDREREKFGAMTTEEKRELIRSFFVPVESIMDKAND